MLPQPLEAVDCETLVVRWGISVSLAAKLLRLDRDWRHAFPSVGGLLIRSGFRTRAEQDELSEQGRPTAPDERSTHRSCPATGADLDLPVAPTAAWKWEFGRLVQLSGLRWGGGSPLDANGIPVDWNHVDEGPRRA